MKTVRTVCVSLEPEYVELLERLARRVGTKSDAVRELLVKYGEREAEREMERVYQEYYSDPDAVRRDRELTESLLPLMSWPEEVRGRGRKRRPAR